MHSNAAGGEGAEAGRIPAKDGYSGDDTAAPILQHPHLNEALMLLHNTCIQCLLTHCSADRLHA